MGNAESGFEVCKEFIEDEGDVRNYSVQFSVNEMQRICAAKTAPDSNIPFIDELFGALVYMNPPERYSASRIYKRQNGIQLSREEQLEMTRKTLSRIDLVGKPMVVCHHSKLVVGRIFAQKIAPKSGNVYILFKLYDKYTRREKGGRLVEDNRGPRVYASICSGRLNGVSMTHDEFYSHENPEDPAIVKAVDVAICHVGARPATRMFRQKELFEYKGELQEMVSNRVQAAKTIISSDGTADLDDGGDDDDDYYEFCELGEFDCKGDCIIMASKGEHTKAGSTETSSEHADASGSGSGSGSADVDMKSNGSGGANGKGNSSGTGVDAVMARIEQEKQARERSEIERKLEIERLRTLSLQQALRSQQQQQQLEQKLFGNVKERMRNASRHYSGEEDKAESKYGRPPMDSSKGSGGMQDDSKGGNAGVSLMSLFDKATPEEIAMLQAKFAGTQKPAAPVTATPATPSASPLGSGQTGGASNPAGTGGGVGGTPNADAKGDGANAALMAQLEAMQKKIQEMESWKAGVKLTHEMEMKALDEGLATFELEMTKADKKQALKSLGDDQRTDAGIREWVKSHAEAYKNSKGEQKSKSQDGDASTDKADSSNKPPRNTPPHDEKGRFKSSKSDGTTNKGNDGSAVKTFEKVALQQLKAMRAYGDKLQKAFTDGKGKTERTKASVTGGGGGGGRNANNQRPKQKIYDKAFFDVSRSVPNASTADDLSDTSLIDLDAAEHFDGSSRGAKRQRIWASKNAGDQQYPGQNTEPSLEHDDDDDDDDTANSNQDDDSAENAEGMSDDDSSTRLRTKASKEPIQRYSALLLRCTDVAAQATGKSMFPMSVELYRNMQKVNENGRAVFAAN